MNKKDAFMIALLEGGTRKEAYQKAGLPARTAYNYLKDESFNKELQARRNEVLSDSIHHLQANLSKCTSVLMEIIENAGTPASVKVQAINSVFSNYKNMSETIELRERIEKLEGRGEMDEVLSD